MHSFEVLNVSWPVLFSLSSLDGSVELIVSSRASFPGGAGETTQCAHDEVLLAPGRPVYRDAVHAAAFGEAPVLYMQVKGDVDKAEGEAETLNNGGNGIGAVMNGLHDRYRFLVTNEGKNIEFSLQASVLSLSCGTNTCSLAGSKHLPREPFGRSVE